ncbi:YbaK/prolyl-tRNA synthetase associated region [Shewanella halifaxensis HAW-EB4]|uniref:YbaK/prolyl-tRNA synthetase associated region n=1 Tax=Shewanella halifaxensis (strain HAW-EB4) TaxID=458817 RepID=B0TT91_SHEHH|nr:YbaK/EbsC family protein [Shewanella halifaxensis]ABZ78032.1 YbaK/prolyl-tRNA synthetase associated region [Shewanella halifaxensis HAW-EB4]
MSISARLNEYLHDNKIDYELVPHPHSFSSLSSAIAANIPPSKLAKAVILEDHEGRRVMAVLPANHKVSLRTLGDKLNRDLRLIEEKEVYEMFGDCQKGAIPSLGEIYNLETVYDDLLVEAKEIYFEAGDHNSLVHMSRENFVRLIKDAKHLRFSHQSIH